MQSSYRSFTRLWLYYNRIFNDGVYQIPHVFPMGQAVENRVIEITSIGARSGFSVLIAKNLPNLDAIDTGQCFPRYLYKNVESSITDHDEKQSHLFTNSIKERKTSGLQRRDAITDKGLAHFKLLILVRP